MAKRVPKDQAKSVTVNLTDDLRRMLLDLNEYQSGLADFDVPLSATVAFAIKRAHATCDRVDRVETGPAPDPEFDI